MTRCGTAKITDRFFCRDSARPRNIEVLLSENNLLGLILLTALAATLVGICVRAATWRRGAPAKVAILRGLLSVPKRYLVDVHAVVARERTKACMHVAAAGGFVASFVLILLGSLFSGVASVAINWLLCVSLTLLMVGAVLVMRRRYPEQPSTLSGGGFRRLGFALAALAVGFALASFVSPAWLHPVGDVLQIVSIALILWGLLETLISMAWGGAMKHAVAGAAHLAFHPRPERFRGALQATGLRLEPLDAARLGVEKPSDFAWNELLGFDACVQCGRCEAVCPAFDAGQPLNPKKLIQDLVVGMSGLGSDASYTGSAHPGPSIAPGSGGPDQPIVPALIAADTLWACTTCRACVYECPMMIEHVDAVVGLRRHLAMEKGELPTKSAQLLDELRHTDNPGGHDPSRRADWAVDLQLTLISDVDHIDLLLWVGDAAFDSRNQQTLRALVALLRKAGVAFAVLGNEELDCGDIARRLGEDALFQSLALRNIENLKRYSFDRILTADPHVLHCLRNEYPALGGDYRVVHHSALLDELIHSGRLRPAPAMTTNLTYHDPCYLGRYNREIVSPRNVLGSLGGNFTEMRRSGMRSRCCGGGGGAPITDVAGSRRIPDMRMADARETGASVVAVSCPNCMTMLEGVVEPRPRVVDIAELLLESVETQLESTNV
jgi:Fe-S oxidoreductase